MSRIKTLAKETAIYGISSILGRMLNWLLVPIYTQYLIPAEYGIVTELYAYVAFLVILYTYGMETAYFRFSTAGKHDEINVFNLSQTSIIFSSLLLSSVLIVFSTAIVNYLEYPGQERYIVWFALILAIDAISAIPFAKLRLEGKSKKFAAYKLINIFINIGLNLFFIVYCSKVVQQEGNLPLKNLIISFFNEENLVDYIFISNLVANGFLIVLMSHMIFRMKIVLDRQTLKSMYRYAFPIMVMSLAGVTNEMLSRAVLKKWLPDGFYEHYSNQAALGIFGAAYKLSVFMTLAIQAFRYAAEPFFFTRAKDMDSRNLFSKVMQVYIIFSSFILILISLNLDIIGRLFLRSPAYREGLVVVPILLLANLFLGIYYNLSVWFKLTDKTYYGTFISLAGALITIVLNFILIPYIGYLGSAFATLFCYSTMAAANFYLGQKHYPVPYEIKKGLLYILLASVITFIGYYLQPELPFNQKIFQILLIFLFLLVVYILDKNQIRLFFRKTKKKK
ncbi:MAG: polysaccharide biosynthesis C-terminal domain-containing protein [Cyclobacteriaceae bacterium]|nr:polysaccharide biosynthesis C-terminal domain-containing protein [Cyclobacteriaceae bacterium]